MRRWLESGVDSTEIARSIDVFVSSLHGSQQSSIAVFDAFLDYIYAGSGPGNLMRNELNWLMHDRRRWNVYTGDGGRRRRDLREAIEWIQINRQLWSAQVEMAAYDSVRGEFLIRAVGLAARTDLDDDASLRRYVGTTLGVSDRDARIFVEGEACGEILDIVTARLVDAIRSEFSDFEKAYRRQRAEPVADSSAAPGHRAG